MKIPAIIITALIIRIISNPCANAIQKKLSVNNSAITINTYSYLFLSIFCVLPAIYTNWNLYNLDFWLYVLLSGLLCTLSSVCLIKALETGEMSVLGPINSYKCVIGLILGSIFLKEYPNFAETFGLIAIILGSWLIFDTTKEGFSIELFKRKDIILRFLALIFSGSEAVVIKKIIIMSSVQKSFMLWCFSGLLFSIILMIVFRKQTTLPNKTDYIKCIEIASFLGLMQLSTNFVFQHMNVGLSLALFQLSSIVAVALGYKMFGEKDFIKKIIGTAIMIGGSCLIIL